MLGIQRESRGKPGGGRFPLTQKQGNTHMQGEAPSCWELYLGVPQGSLQSAPLKELRLPPDNERVHSS